jgi:hypothetical protein
MRRPIAAVFALTSTVFYFIACGSDTPTAPSAAKLPASSVALNALAVSGHGAHSASTASHTTAALSADVHQQIAEVRAFLAPFHNFKKAEEYGYSVRRRRRASASRIRPVAAWGTTTPTRRKTSLRMVS